MGNDKPKEEQKKGEPRVTFKDSKVEGALALLPPELKAVLERPLKDMTNIYECPVCGKAMRMVKARCTKCGHEEEYL